VPLFLSATRPALPGPAAEEQAIRLGGRPCVVVGRGGLTVTVPRDPYVPAADVEALRQQGARWLRAAFLWRRHEPAAVRDWWRRHAAGPPAP
jgi:hypothetical protein